MIVRVTESTFDGSKDPEVFDLDCASTSIGPRGELLVYGSTQITPIAGWADGAWDKFQLYETKADVPVPVPLGSSAPSTTGPSTFAQSPDTGPLMNDPVEAATPGASPEPEPDLVGAESVMTSESGMFEGVPVEELRRLAMGGPAALAPEDDARIVASDPGLPVTDDGNTKVVVDGQGNPVVLARNADGTWRTVSPDDLPATVRPGLVEDPAPATT